LTELARAIYREKLGSDWRRAPDLYPYISEEKPKENVEALKPRIAEVKAGNESLRESGGLG